MLENRSSMVKTYPISKIIKQSGLKYIGYFSIDVEGGELTVLETMDWSYSCLCCNYRIK